MLQVLSAFTTSLPNETYVEHMFENSMMRLTLKSFDKELKTHSQGYGYHSVKKQKIYFYSKYFVKTTGMVE